MKYRRLNLDAYPRRAHFDYFRTLADPYVGVTVDVDVTELAALCHEMGRSFYLVFLRAAVLAANRVPELRQRILDGGIVEYERCESSHIELLENGAYCYCALTHDPEQSLEDYLAYAEAARIACKSHPSIDEAEDALGQYFISTVPWLHYTSLHQPTAGGDESNPRITWGKYAPDFRGRRMMPVTLLAHHALVDGLQIAQFYDYLNEEISKMKE